jgi:hypothetical protein
VLVLSEKTLFSYSLEALDPNENNAVTKRPRKICHANFFKSGICLGQQLVASVKTSTLSTTIKVFEPKENMANKSRKSGFAKMLSTGQDQLKPYKEFYIPTESTSIHFLRSKLCVGCAKGFEVVSLETLETQSLLDQADTSLDFVVRKENIKPIHIERLASEFLLCYTDYSFFVNRNGWRARPDWRIAWEGTPQAFAIFHPYILAFEPSFIEIRHMESGALVHIVTAKNIRWLHTSTREVCEPSTQSRRVRILMRDRLYMHMKMNWATMLSQAWTSGKRHLGTSNPSRPTVTMRRTEGTERIPDGYPPPTRYTGTQAAPWVAFIAQITIGWLPQDMTVRWTSNTIALACVWLTAQLLVRRISGRSSQHGSTRQQGGQVQLGVGLLHTFAHEFSGPLYYTSFLARLGVSCARWAEVKRVAGTHKREAILCDSGLWLVVMKGRSRC